MHKLKSYNFKWNCDFYICDILPVRKKTTHSKKTKKSEDKERCKWYEGLDKKEHEAKLKQLGLADDEIEEWENMQEKGVTLEDLEAATTTDDKPTKKTKKKQLP